MVYENLFIMPLDYKDEDWWTSFSKDHVKNWYVIFLSFKERELWEPEHQILFLFKWNFIPNPLKIVRLNCPSQETK